MKKPSDMQLVGRDGEMLLYTTKNRKIGVLYNALRKSWSDPQPLQAFFKWGNFEAVDKEVAGGKAE